MHQDIRIWEALKVAACKPTLWSIVLPWSSSCSEITLHIPIAKLGA